MCMLCMSFDFRKGTYITIELEVYNYIIYYARRRTDK